MKKAASPMVLWLSFTIRILIALPVMVFSACFLWNSMGPLPQNRSEIAAQAMERINGLEIALKEKDAARYMQEVFPEGACFCVTLYGLAWANVTKLSGPDDANGERALEEIAWALEQQETPVVLFPFSDTQVRNGVFWLGQRNLLLAQYFELLSESERPATLVEEFHENSRTLTEAFLESPTHHLDSYPSMCWPADNVTALVSLVIHDELYNTDYRKALEAWKGWTREHADPLTGMAAGHLRRRDGFLIESARGCGNSWMIPLLSRIDRAYALELYSLHKKHFAIRRLGYGMFREWPHGWNGHGADCDSGPIILGSGMTATGAGLAAVRSMGDVSMEADILDLSLVFGFQSRWQTEKGMARECLWGLLPVGDAILAWGESLERPADMAHTMPTRLQRMAHRWTFYISLTLIITLAATYAAWAGIRLRNRLAASRNTNGSSPDTYRDVVIPG